MESLIIQQLQPLFIYTISGLAIGILFDMFRVLRKTFKTADFITYIEDIIFWILTGLFLIYISLKTSYGEIRIYNIVGLIIGLIFYMLLFSKLFIKIGIKILNIIIYPFKLTLKFLKKLTKPFTFFVINIKKLNLNSKKCKKI